MVEITTFRLERIFQSMSELKFVSGQVVYNLAYNQILQTEETQNDKQSTVQMKKMGTCLFYFMLKMQST